MNKFGTKTPRKKSWKALPLHNRGNHIFFALLGAKNKPKALRCAFGGPSCPCLVYSYISDQCKDRIRRLPDVDVRGRRIRGVVSKDLIVKFAELLMEGSVFEISKLTSIDNLRGAYKPT